MKTIYTPNDESELAIIRSMLDSADIPYRIVNQYFGSLYIGPAMGNLNSKPVMVPEEYFDDACEILAGFLEHYEKEPDNVEKTATPENGILEDLGDLVYKFLGLIRKR